MSGMEMNRRSVVIAAAAGGAATLGGASAALAAPSKTTKPAAARTLSVGSRGKDVLTVQNRLNTLGYWCGGADGAFGSLTQQAVYAIQKVAGLKRTGVVDAATQSALSKGVRPTSRRGGNRIEVDKTRQILMVVRGGQPLYTFNTSTGSGQFFTYYGQRMQAVTPSGEFKTFRKMLSGWDYGALGGLWRPFYFNGGIAIHGATEIPPTPASHGCCRLSMSAQDFLIAKNYLWVGEQVSVY